MTKHIGPAIFIRNYLLAKAKNVTEQNAAASLLAATPENRPGPRVSFETPLPRTGIIPVSLEFPLAG